MNNFQIPIQLTIKQFDLSAIDSDGLVLVIVGYCIVFMALLLLYFFFRYIIPSILRVKIGKSRIHKDSDSSEKNQKLLVLHF